MKNGRIILLNGTSSSGKSTLVKALRDALQEPFCYYASDQLADGGFRAIKREPRHAGSRSERERFFDGFHRSILSFAEAGNDMIVEHIVEKAEWARALEALLAGLDVFWVGVHAPKDEIERRELQRGDRSIGEANFHLKTHNFCKYDIEVDTSQPQHEVVARIIDAWRRRHEP